ESLLVVQKERDVALQRLANANLPAKSELHAGSTAAAIAASGRGNGTVAPNRRALGIDVAPTATPTKLRLPSRASKGMRHEQSTPSTPLSRMASGAELRGSANAAKPLAQLTRMGSSSAISLQEEQSPLMRKMQEEIDSLRRENKRAAEDSSAESERLTLQIQEQAKEISRLRRQHTGRRESDRYSLLPFKENSWGAAKSAASSSSSTTAHRHLQHGDARDRARGDEGNGPNLLRAAYIKAVVENELQRCVRARQLLRERDSFLAEQDQLMNQQNDLLLSMQNLQQDSEAALASDEDDAADDKSLQMQRVSEKIEIIDAELHHLDLKVRDAEAEVAQLAEAAPANDDLNGSGLLVAPAIINMSGLAMRIVEDVVRVDYRAFVDLFQSLPQADSTGLAYLLMQDIIEHRLVTLRDARERAALEEQAMDLRRTLLAMQKTALNAALSYERELGHAERKLDQLLPPSSSLSPASHQLSRRGSAARNGEYPGEGPDYDRPSDGGAAYGSGSSPVPANDAAVVDRAIYEGVRERGILLRSALISALEAPAVGNEASVSRVGRAEGWDGGGADNMSMENIRGAKAHVAEWSEDASDFASLSEHINEDDISVSDNASLPYDSVNSRFSPADPTRANMFSELHAEPESDLPPPATPADSMAHVNSSGEDMSHVFADASDVFDPQMGMAGLSASRVALPPRSRLNMVSSPTESDTSFAATPRSHYTSPATNTQTVTVVDDSPVDTDRDEEYTSDAEASGSEGDLPELYLSSNGENFRIPNLARNQSTRSRNRSRRRHLIRRTSMRKQIAAAPPRVGPSGSIGRRRRGSLRKARIGLPIVPPEMIDYIDRRHPTAISVGGAPPMVASPEMLRAMRIVPDAEYRGNIAAFASFAMNQNPATMSPPLPPRRQSIAKGTAEPPLTDTALAASPADSSRTKISSASPDIGPQMYTPRSAGKVASRMDVPQSPGGLLSPHTVPACLGNPPASPAASILWSPVTIGGAPSSTLVSADNTYLPTANTTPQQQHSPASARHHSPDAQLPSRKSTLSMVSGSPHPGDNHDAGGLCASPALSSPRASSRNDAAVQEQCTSPTRLRREISKALVMPSSDHPTYAEYPGFRRPYSAMLDSSVMIRPAFAAPESPRPHSALVSANAAELPQRFLSPTEHANASLFSMLDATHTASNGDYSASDVERDESQDSSLANIAGADGTNADRVRDSTLDKPARIRRRAQTANVNESSSTRRNSDRVDKAGSRLSRIFSGFGLGGSKKPPSSSSS
ncbi:hypothetical protein H4S07_003729, partial [Coemansia furcata]